MGGQGWGNKKKYFYGGNPNERGQDQEDDLDVDEMNEAELEAQESGKLQKKMMEQMDDEDFLDAFVETEKVSSGLIMKHVNYIVSKI